MKRVADQDGDGLADALVWVELDDFSSIQVLLVQGPLRRDLVVADRVREPIDLEGRFTGVVDLNLDGVGDRSRYDEGTGELRITWGPVSRWGEAAPDVVFTPPLCPGGHTHTRHFDTPQVIHDVTGDGLHELILGARYRCSGSGS
ncbi:MAG: hypothetical protein KTR31_14710 [Myxococcales bacterium]|nr:hypothetical protein [Myxococcales bacterium]